MWYLSLGGTSGTQAEVRQRSVQVHVTCAKRPMSRRVMTGWRTIRYGVKPVDTRRRVVSTSFVSATTARRAVTTSPNRCTVGVTVAYAFSGTPSPSADPDGAIGRVAAAGAA